MKRLYRSQKDRVFAGVCGGIAEYYKKDPTLIRLFWVLATLLTGIAIGVIGYFVAWIIIPEKN